MRKVLTVLAIGLVTACGSGGPAAAPATTAAPTTTHDMAHMAATAAATEAGLGGCAQHMPGELLTADEAVVRFDTQMVCLGYVTVTPGTTITWSNGDTADHVVTILDDEDAELNEFSVAAGDTVTTPAAGAGVYRFRLTAIGSFVGTIEVQAN